MSAEFYAISFVILVILAHWAINSIGDWLYPKVESSGLESMAESRRREASSVR